MIHSKSKQLHFNMAQNESYLKWMWSQINVVSNECSLDWTWSHVNVVSNECGHKRKWSQMNMFNRNVVLNVVVSDKRVLKW